MKKIVLLLVVALCLTSCFYTHRAREIEVYDLDYPKKEGEGLTTYAFEYTGNKNVFEKRTKAFFDLSQDYLPSTFYTKTLYAAETLTVYLYSGKDKDKYVNLFSSILSSILNNDDEYTPEATKKRHEEEESVVKEEEHKYIFIQVTDAEGKDVLATKCMIRNAVIKKLTRYKNLVN